MWPLRCAAQVVALGPTHQCFEVGRTKERPTSKAMPDNADIACYELVARIRNMYARLPKEAQATTLEQALVDVGLKPMVAIGDSSSKWNSVMTMLERHWEMRKGLKHVAVTYPATFLDNGKPLSVAELVFIWHIHTVLNSWAHASSILQSDKPQFLFCECVLA